MYDSIIFQAHAWGDSGSEPAFAQVWLRNHNEPKRGVCSIIIFLRRQIFTKCVCPRIWHTQAQCAVLWAVIGQARVIGELCVPGVWLCVRIVCTCVSCSSG